MKDYIPYSEMPSDKDVSFYPPINNSPEGDELNPLQNLPISAEHAVIYQLLLRVLGEDFPADELFSLSDDELISLPGIGITKLNKIHNYIEFVQMRERSEGAEDFVPVDLDERQLALLFSDLEVPDTFRVARKALLVCLGPAATVGDVLSLTGVDILNLPGVGSKKVGEILTLQNALQRGEYLTEDADPERVCALAVEILERPFAEVVVTSKYNVEKSVLLTLCGEEATIAEVLAVDRTALSKQQGVGRKKVTKVLSFLEEIRSGSLVGLEIDEIGPASPEMNLSEDEESSFLEVLEPLLVDAMDSYISGLSEAKRYIFCSRHGIDCETLTLDQVGETYPRGSVTRERIRQLQKPLDRDWPLLMGVSPRKLWFSVQEHLSLLHEPALQNWKSRFHQEKDFFDFLALSCGVETQQIRDIVFPKFSTRILDRFWTYHESPAQLLDVVDSLSEETGQEIAVLENILHRLNGSGHARIKGDQIWPQNLAKTLAVGHIMLRMPDGATWEKIHKTINDSRVCRTECSLERMDHGINDAVERGWIYQSGRGSYRHVNFVVISDERIDEILKNLKQTLVEARNNGRDALTLMVDFFQYRSLQEDYFTVRHCVRTYGEREGIFFNGKSGADTVSLDAEFSLVSQEEAIVEFISQQKGAVTVEQIALIIRSQSHGHAFLYCENLFTNGRIVKVQVESYAIPEMALSGIDIPVIVAEAAIIIENESRIIEIDILRKRLNRRLDLQMNRHLLLFILQHEAKKFGYHWHCTTDLISKNTMVYSGITAIIRDLISQGYDETNLLMEQLDKLVLANPDRVQTTIYHVKRDVAQANIGVAKNTDMSLTDSTIRNMACQPAAKAIGVSQRRAMKTLANRFRQLVQQRLQSLGISEDQAPDFGASEVSGVQSLDDLRTRVNTCGFETVLEQETGAWFNRFCALRFMEVNGYLVHRLRIFSHPESSGFEILNHALDVVDDLELDRAEIELLKLSGTQDEDLYRKILLAQCQQLHQWMPFLFPAADDSSYLLLPDNLLRTDSLIRILVDELPDEYWHDLTIINELYNTYAGNFSSTSSTTVDKPSASVSRLYELSPGIPQWLARSMVENSLGRLWQKRSAEAGLDELFDYFIPENQDRAGGLHRIEAEQVVNPESLKILDPFSGSGVFLVEAYRLLREIYQQCGYRKRDIPGLILEKNLFGLVFDQHSEQMSRFSLMMAARADDRHFFSRVNDLNIHLLSDSIHSDQATLAPFRNEPLLQWSSHISSLGYLLKDSDHSVQELDDLRGRYEDDRWHQLLDQTICIQQTYDVIVTRPPSPQKIELPDIAWQHQLFGTASGTGRGSGFGIDDLFSDKCLMKLKPGGFAAILGRDDWMLRPQYQTIRDDRLFSRICG